MEVRAERRRLAQEKRQQLLKARARSAARLVGAVALATKRKGAFTSSVARRSASPVGGPFEALSSASFIASPSPSPPALPAFGGAPGMTSLQPSLTTPQSPPTAPPRPPVGTAKQQQSPTTSLSPPVPQQDQSHSSGDSGGGGGGSGGMDVLGFTEFLHLIKSALATVSGDGSSSMPAVRSDLRQVFTAAELKTYWATFKHVDIDNSGARS